MITEVVTFPLPAGTSREELMDKYRQTVDRWRNNPDLIRKHYFYDPDGPRGGGVYVWKNREAVDKWHGREFRDLIRTHYGSEPESRCFDTMIVVDNENGAVSEIDSE